MEKESRRGREAKSGGDRDERKAVGRETSYRRQKTQQGTLDCYKIKPVFTGVHGSWLGIGTSLQSCWHDEKGDINLYKEDTI